jgi:hypothetical protein
MNDPGPTPTIADLLAEIAALKREQASLCLATTGTDGQPEASHAPFVADDMGRLYVFVSALAAHTGNMLATPSAGALVLDPDSGGRQPFARRRLVYQCRVEEIDRDTDEFARRIDDFKARFGNVVDTLRALPDFRLLRLTPQSGRYIRGFGQAYEIPEGEDAKLRPVMPGNS